tara:strand:+ start:1930 stop:2289 length:360 start_codon:yes stop_codon:yes gene_type:complete
MHLEQVNLTNSRIRLALQTGDSKTAAEATLQLCNDNEQKARQLASWFSEVANKCKKDSKISEDMTLMRMWQLGNMDIKQISNDGTPTFTLTITGIEKINKSPRSKWHEVLLWSNQQQPV